MAISVNSADSDFRIYHTARMGYAPGYTYLAWMRLEDDTVSSRLGHYGLTTTGVGGPDRQLLNFLGNINAKTVQSFNQMNVGFVTMQVSSSNIPTWGIDKWMFYGLSVVAGGATTDQHMIFGDLTTIATETTYAQRTVGAGTQWRADHSSSLLVGNITTLLLRWRGSISFVGAWNRAMSVEEMQGLQFNLRPVSGCVLFCEYGNYSHPYPDHSGNGAVGHVSGSLTVVPNAPIKIG